MDHLQMFFDIYHLKGIYIQTRTLYLMALFHKLILFSQTGL